MFFLIVVMLIFVVVVVLLVISVLATMISDVFIMINMISGSGMNLKWFLIRFMIWCLASLIKWCNA